MRGRQRIAQVRAGLARWAALVALIVACGRTGLDSGEQARTVFGPGGTGLGGTTGSGGTSHGGTGATTASGAARSGGTTGTGGSNGGGTSDAGCAASPPPRCVPGPQIATALGAYEDGWNVLGIATSGEELFIATSRGDGTSTWGHIMRISLRTLSRATHDVQGFPADLGYQAGAVVYRPSFYNPSDPFEPYAPTVLRWELATDATAVLPNPTDFPASDIGPVAANAKGEIFWSLRQEGRTAIARWDPCSGQTEVLAAARDAVALLADDKSVYWQEPTGGRGAAFAGHTLLYSLPIAKGGTASLLVDEPTYSWNAPGLLANDKERLYYRTNKKPELGVQSIPKGGGTPQSVIPDADPLRLDSSTIDETHIYWVGFDAQETLRRTPKQGGPTEQVWTGKDRFIQAVAVDACNVYWVAANGPEIYYRAK